MVPLIMASFLGPQKSWQKSRYFLANVRCLGTLPWMPFFHSLFLIVKSFTLTLIDASKACSSLDVVLGSFMTSWMSRHCALGVILVGRPPLGRFTTVPSFLHNTFQTDTCQLFCFSSVLEIL